MHAFVNVHVCVCVCLCSLCNETPEVSEGHSGVMEERMGAQERRCSCIVVPLLKLSLCV